MSKKKNSSASLWQAGDIIEGAVSGCSHEGLGVVRHKSGVIFVKNSLPGEQVRLRVDSKRRGVFFGTALEILEKSPQRTEPVCRIFGECGGCALQHCAYEEQLRLKGEVVKNALSRIGKLDEASGKIYPVAGMAEPYHYRNKGVFRVGFGGEDGGRLHLGFLQEGSHQVAAGRCSLLFPTEINRLLDIVESALSQDEYKRTAAALTKVMVRRSAAYGEIMLILMIKAEAADKRLDGEMEGLWQRLHSAESLLKVFGYSLDHGETNPIYDNLTFCSERRQIKERLGDVEYEISPASFFQVNSRQTAKMLDYIRRIIPKSTGQIIDAYSGIGTIGLALAGVVQRVECIEVVPQAVADAESNCRLNHFTNVGCHCGRAEDLFRRVAKKSDDNRRLVIVDPPRKGCHSQLLQGILDFAPEHIIYVSCNPATLARDLAILSESYGVESVQPFDMFPQSHHVETVVLMGKE